MYKVYLLDDEPYILEGLKYILDWEDYGFEIVGCASNGCDGLEEILNKEIDLVITDIMMPKMTGLELIKNLRKENYQTNFIVLSAFQEFEYAKEAISLGAQNYILKPIDTYELEKSLKIIYEKLKQRENQNKDKDILNNNLLFKMITDSKNEEIKDDLDRLGISNKGSKYCVSIVELKESKSNIKELLIQSINEKDMIYCIENKSRALLIINTDDYSYTNKLSELIKRIENINNTTIYISIGKEVTQLKELEDSYYSAKKVSEYKIVYPDKSWIKKYREHEKCKDIDIDLKKLKNILKEKDFSNVFLFIDEIFNQLKSEEKLSAKDIKTKSLEVFLSVYNNFNDSKMIKGLNSYLEKAIEKETIDEIQLELVSMIKYIKSKLENTEDSISPVILKLLDHIDKYYERDLNLKEISDDLNINSIYLGQLFQKETGVLFSDYINNFRIKKAKDLLINSNLKASEIGDLVGYANKNYFYRKFKDIVGVTPSEWRKMNL